MDEGRMAAPLPPDADRLIASIKAKVAERDLLRMAHAITGECDHPREWGLPLLDVTTLHPRADPLDWGWWCGVCQSDILPIVEPPLPCSYCGHPPAAHAWGSACAWRTPVIQPLVVVSIDDHPSPSMEVDDCRCRRLSVPRVTRLRYPREPAPMP